MAVSRDLELNQLWCALIARVSVGMMCYKYDSATEEQYMFCEAIVVCSSGSSGNPIHEVDFADLAFVFRHYFTL